MNLYEFAWYNSYEITQKTPGEVRLLIRDFVPFPFLEKDERGYIIFLPKMKRVGERTVKYQDMLFNIDNENHDEIIWNLFKASVCYLSVFTIASNIEAYSDYVKDVNDNLALNVINLVADATINSYVKAFHKTLLPNIAFADAVSYLLLKPADIIRNEGVQFVSSILSYYKTGMTKGNIPEKMLSDTKYVVAKLKELENETLKLYSDNKGKPNNDQLLNLNEGKREKIFSEIYESLSKYCNPILEVPSFLYMNHLNKSSVFYKTNLPTEDEIKRVFGEITGRLNLEIDFNMYFFKNDAVQVISDWETREKSRNKILEKYKLIGSGTHFKSFVFPDEDYAEFIRRKERHTKSVRRVLNRLAVFYNLSGEEYRRETGGLDLQEAIQVTASQSRRTDVFLDESLQSRGQSWAILVDVSRSLRSFAGEVKDVILCLSEVARKLFHDNRSLGVFAFDDKFYVIKDFSETYSTFVGARIGGIEHSGMTYLPDGIKIVSDALRRQSEDIKIMVVVSDGFPTGYRDVTEETKNQIIKAGKSGIDVIGIGINSKRIEDYFSVYCVVKNPHDLMKSFANTFFQYTS